MALRRLCTEKSNLISSTNSITVIRYYNNLLIHRKQNFCSKGFPPDIANHIEQLKSIATEQNKAHILPKNNKLKTKKTKSSKSKSSRSRNNYINHDKYSFNFHQTKSEQNKLKQKQKLSKILNLIQSESMPISQRHIRITKQIKNTKFTKHR